MKTYMGCISSRLSSFKLSLRSIILAVLFSAVFYELSFSSQVFALYTPTLSASVDNTAASVNGNQVINTTYKTTEIYLNLTVNTNNKTGYAATLNSETDETALVNSDSANGAKINSISTSLPLNNLPNNSWGYKLASATNYVPIPALSTPAQILQTAGETSGNETNGMKIGLKLSDNLESGRYTNKLIFSILTNNYDRIALMTNGPIFNTKLKSLETATNKIERFKKSAVAPAASMNAVNVEDENSDYEIKLWLDPVDKIAYYYAETEKVYLNRYCSQMFYAGFSEQKIKNILELDLSSFDTSKVTDMGNMFSGISSLTTLNLSRFDTSKVWNMGSMFSGMINLTTLNLSNFDTSKVTNMSFMFDSMRGLTNLNLSNFDTSNVTDMCFMFSSVSKLTNLNLSSFGTSKVTNMGSMFSGMSSLTNLNLSSFDTSQVTNMGHMFYDTRNLTSINLSHFDTSKVTSMRSMFCNMANLTTLDLSNFDTSQVTDMGYMFSYMPNLTTLNLSSFDTSNVKDMGSMFSSVYKLTTLNLSSFDTSKVTNMESMFDSMQNLTTLNLSNFDTSSVTNMNAMFYGMSNLTTLNLVNFNTSQVTNMRYMFASMPNLVTLDISNFDTSKVNDISSVFALRDEDKLQDKLEKIYVNNDFDTTNVTNFSEMFKNRKKLRGGAGSYLANPSTADKSWLRIDDPTNGRPGYFIKKL